jgi:membrane-bound lytic murein transglycosylase B
MSFKLTRPLLLALLGFALTASVPAPAEAASRDVALDVPARYLLLYQKAGQRFRISWQLLAGVGKMETNHGRVRLPGVHRGVNRAGCCAGPMQFSVLSSAPTWQLYRVDGNGDGRRSVYDPADAIPSAAKMLAGLKRRFQGSGALALAAYNAGPGNVRRFGGVPPFAETRNYVQGGMRYARMLGYTGR